MTRLEKLVSLCIQGIEAPTVSSIDNHNTLMRDEEFVGVKWQRQNKTVTLCGCEHHLRLEATLFDGGPCPPEREFSYSHTRLLMLLNWLNGDENIDGVDALNRSAAFHQKFVDDPPVTKHMYGGRIDPGTWGLVKKLWTE